MKANETSDNTKKAEAVAVKTEAKTEAKTTGKEETAKKTTAKKTTKATTKKADTGKEETAKKDTKKTTKAATKKKDTAKEGKTTRKTAVKSELYIQYNGNQLDEQTLLDRVQTDCEAQGVKVKELKLYLKPEDNACYYVANGNVAGRVDLY